MVTVIKEIMDMVNEIHDLINKITDKMGYSYNDKQLHFIVIGIVGIILFLITQVIFKYISKYSITAISFIYTFTILLVIVFAIEIGQKITGRGHMEFKDITAGLFGFLYLFLFYVIIRLIIFGVKKIFNKDEKRRRR